MSRRVGGGSLAAAMAVVLAVAVAHPATAAAEVPAPVAAQPADGAGDCLARAQAGSCTLGVNPAGVSRPYTLAVPAGMTSVTVLLTGGRGADGDGLARGGAGGLTVAQIPVPAGDSVDVYVATGASSTTPGSGWRSGGRGITARGVESDSGGGGGASAVLVTGATDPLLVAGGGGGAGGTFNEAGEGGSGGSAGLPAVAGSDGTGPNSTSEGLNRTNPGGGGCANGSGCGSGNSGSDGNGGVSSSFFAQEGGGGGGAGWPIGGGSGGSAFVQPTNPLEFAGGGGGAGGQNFVDPAGTTLATAGTGDQDGSVTFLPTGGVTTIACTAPTTWTAPAGTASVIGIAVGGTGGDTSDPDLAGAPGSGALAIGVLPTTAGQQLAVTPGCEGYGRNGSPGLGRSGGGGDAPADNADSGGGGGGGSTIAAAAGTPLLTAGGGGGSGGYAQSDFNNALKPSVGGRGGTAGLGWGRGGAGLGGSGGTYGNQYPQGGPSANPTGDGDAGSDGVDIPASGGGGGGGGGLPRGGQGGNTSDGDGGGGGTAGQSSYDATVGQPRIGTSSGATDGRVLLIPLPTVIGVGYDNDGIGVAGSSAAGFDGVGNQYDPTALAGQGVRPGGPVGVGPVVLTWPDVPADAADNYLAHGQTVPLSGTGSTLAVLGASTFGTGSGTATVTYTDGTTSQFSLAFADWVDGTSPVPGTTNVIDVSAASSQQTVYGRLVALTPGKQAVSLTLPDVGAAVGDGITALHVFAAATGGPNNQGISAATAPTGLFDGSGDAYAPAGLAAAGLTPGAAFTALGADMTWPAYAPGVSDNYVAQGQQVGLYGSGDRLVVTGAASYGGPGGVGGAATITYQDGTTSNVDLRFADWVAGPALAGQAVVTTIGSDQGAGGRRVFALSVPLDPAKTVVAVTLPTGPPALAGTAALHVFTLGFGSGGAPGADLRASLDVAPSGVAAARLTGSAVPAGSSIRVTVRVDHLGSTGSGRYGTAVLLPPGVEPTDLGGGFRLGQLVVFTGKDLQTGGSDTRSITVTAPPPGVSAIGAVTLGTTPDPHLFNNVAGHVLVSQ